MKSVWINTGADDRQSVRHALAPLPLPVSRPGCVGPPDAGGTATRDPDDASMKKQDHLP